MMALQDADTDELLRRAAGGDRSAVNELLARHRNRLRQMVVVRMDPRLSARVDPSDVVQEALAEAAQSLSDYLRDRPLPFYPWLRRLAWRRLVEVHRRHVEAKKRSVTREVPWDIPLSDQSAVVLADRLMASGTSPSQRLIRDELRDRVRLAIARLPSRDREVLVLRYLEQLSISEIAAVMEISEGAVNMRQVRAVERLHELLSDEP